MGELWLFGIRLWLWSDIWFCVFVCAFGLNFYLFGTNLGVDFRLLVEANCSLSEPFLSFWIHFLRGSTLGLWNLSSLLELFWSFGTNLASEINFGPSAQFWAVGANLDRGLFSSSATSGRIPGMLGHERKKTRILVSGLAFNVYLNPQM